MPAASSTITPIRREFLGWDKPALPEAARRIAARYRSGQTLNLGQVIVVVPGQRAGRRLMELLAFLAADEKLRLTPPDVVTEGRLPEMLYTSKQPFANDVVQDLTWAQALRALPADQRHYVVPHAPGDADVLRWLEIGKLLHRLHVEFAAEGLDFAAVATTGQKLEDYCEADRWHALAAVQRRYLDLLDRLGLWDIQTARLKAIEFGEIGTESDIILLGTVDLNQSLRHMLDQVAARVTAYIVAPDDVADWFDEHGCLVAGKWREAPVPLRDEQLRQVDGPLDQAEAVTAWLAELDGRYRQDEVAIGVPDVALVPQLQRQLEQYGLRARWVEGVRLGLTAPYRLLAAAVQFAGGHRYEDLAALLRHPDLDDWLQAALPKRVARDAADGATSLPAQLDRFYNRHLPSRIGAGQVHAQAREWPDLAPTLERIETWLQEAATKHPLRTWGGLFGKILGEVYGERMLHLDTPADDVMHRTLGRILQECNRLGSVPEALDRVALPATDAFHVVLGPLAAEALPPPAEPEALEILGWLELPLDDSPALVVTSFNEGFVPQSTGPDAFLPDRLRQELGLLHNERRYARDAYAIAVLCASRQNLRVLFARRDTLNDPVQPSRLLFACPDDVLVCRARQFFGEQKTPPARRHLLLASAEAIPEKSLFEVPRPVRSGRKLTRISVTHFKAYLACPYRYYLRHDRRLQAVDDAARELDGAAFGKLLHRVLGAFGKGADGPKHSDREQDIFDFLAERLDRLAERVYGSAQRRPAIRLQLEQARRRLKMFASRQAAEVRKGWRIVYVEDEDEDDLAAAFPADEEPITLVGRIDRIDCNEGSKTIRILDYKTGDRHEAPQNTHQRNEHWIDLQLPLYRHLWKEGWRDGPANWTVALGYFNLPKKLDETGVVDAPWDEAMLRGADEEARTVIRNLRRGVFWPPQYHPVPDYCEDLAAICLDNTLGRPALREDDDGGPA